MTIRQRPRAGGDAHVVTTVPGAVPIDVTFPCMGSEVRLLVTPPPGDDGRRLASERVAAARAWLEDYDARLSRFRPGSELSALNADPRPVVPASPLLRSAVAAARWAAERSGGLVDPALAAALIRQGYGASRAGVPPAPLAEAVAAAPARRPARPHPDARWREIEVRDAAIARPPGLTIDTGGSGKGLAADLVADQLAGLPRFVVDCGGDVRLGGLDAAAAPLDVVVAHPFDGGAAHTVAIGAGAIATSGIDVRLWRRPDGGFAHHLLDPATGEPAWTGLVAATALAPTALEAETRAKAALLAGPDGAGAWLAPYGGMLVHDDGRAELAGPLADPLVVRADDLARHLRPLAPAARR